MSSDLDSTKAFDLHAMWHTVPQSWQQLMKDLPANVWQGIQDAIAHDLAKGGAVFPYDFFYALRQLEPQDIKVVILGQDPYHNIINQIPQAHGLAFSVPKGIPIPPSLKNIDKELYASLDIPFPSHGCLDAWAKQGIFLLNSILSVRAHEAASHAKIGWQVFTDYLIVQLAAQCQHIVWMLWGNYAHSKSKLISSERHLVLCAAHPSPLSAHRGFLGSGHFKQAYDYVLNQRGIQLDFTR